MYWGTDFSEFLQGHNFFKDIAFSRINMQMIGSFFFWQDIAFSRLNMQMIGSGAARYAQLSKGT
jgi:hypothetical protein